MAYRAIHARAGSLSGTRHAQGWLRVPTEEAWLNINIFGAQYYLAFMLVSALVISVLTLHVFVTLENISKCIY